MEHSAFWIESIGWTLIHGVWQGSVFAGLAFAAMSSLRRHSANLRYAVGCTALILTLISLPVTFAWTASNLRVKTVVGRVNHNAAVPEQNTEISSLPDAESNARQIVEPNVDFVAGRGYQASLIATSEIDHRPESDNRLAVPSSFLLWQKIESRLRPHLFIMVMGWLVGTLLSSLRPLIGLRFAWRLRTKGLSEVPTSVTKIMEGLTKRLGLKRAVSIFQSNLVQIPCVVGSWKPVVLLPISALTGLTPQQLEAVIAHELAHLRRCDDLINVLQTFAETILFYHPAIWWMSHRLRVEREHCCDDLVVTLLQDPTEYCRALLAIETSRTEASQAVFALGVSDGSLLSRIRRISETKYVRPTSTFDERWPITVIVTLSLLSVFLFAINGARAEKGTETSAEAPNSNRVDQKVEANAQGKSTKTSTEKTTLTEDPRTGPIIPAHHIRGRVVDLNDNPVSGARLWWVLFPSLQNDNVIEGISDSEGRFQLEAPEYQIPRPSASSNILWAVADGYQLNAMRAIVDITQSAPTTDILIRLQDQSDTSFKIVDPQGDPVADVGVEPYMFSVPNWATDLIPETARRLLSVKTDANGIAKLPAIDRKRFYQVQLHSEEYGIQKFRVDRKDSAKPLQTLKFQKTGSLKGQLIGVNNESMQGIKIWLETEGRISPGTRTRNQGFASAVTDETGQFFVPTIASGDLRIYVIRPNESFVLPRIPINEVVAGNTTEIVIPFERTVVVRGSIRTLDTDAPVAGAELSIRHGDGRSFQVVHAVTDPLGNYEAKVLSGPIFRQIIMLPREIAGRYEQVGSPWNAPYEVTTNTTVEVPVIKLTPTIDVPGKVVDQNGQPVIDSSVNVVHQTRRYGFCKSNERGEFQSKIPAGISIEYYQVRIRENAFSVTIESREPLVLRVTPKKNELEK